MVGSNGWWGQGDGGSLGVVGVKEWVGWESKGDGV